MDASGKYTKSAQHSKTFSLFAGAFSYFPTLLSHSSLQPLVIMDSSSLKHRQFELNTKPLSFYIWLYHFVNPPSLSTRLPPLALFHCCRLRSACAHRIDPGRGHAGDGSVVPVSRNGIPPYNIWILTENVLRTIFQNAYILRMRIII